MNKCKEMSVYTDGSYGPERGEGTYAWVAGWHGDGGNLGIIMSGGGLERNSGEEQEQTEIGHHSKHTQDNVRQEEKEPKRHGEVRGGPAT